MQKRPFFIFISHILLESLPVSSSTHVELLAHALKLPIQAFSKKSMYLMHLPSLSIIFFFLLLHGAPTQLSFPFISALLMTTLITLAAYFIKKDAQPIGLKTGITLSATLLLSLIFLRVGPSTGISILDGIAIGLAQAVALLPGISRLGATCATGLWVGLSPHDTFIYSLSAEFILLCGALITVPIREWYEFFFSFSPYQWVSILLSSFASYGLLIISYYTLGMYLFWIFGLYLLILTLVLYSKDLG